MAGSPGADFCHVFFFFLGGWGVEGFCGWGVWGLLTFRIFSSGSFGEERE